jgi:DNA-directed RNA polymerase subunit H
LGLSKVPLDNLLIPKHEILPKDEEDKLLASCGISRSNLPRIRSNDPQTKALGAKVGDVLRIARKDTTGENVYYRVVIK